MKTDANSGLCKSTLVAVAMSAILTACGGSDDPAPRSENPTPVESDSQDRLYLVAGAQFTPDGAVGYAALIKSVEAGTEVDLSQALVVSGFSNIAADPAKNGVFYVGDAQEPVLRKYQGGRDGTFTLLDEVSFANQGLAAAVGIRNPMHFVSETQAYFINARSYQIIVWNPAEMTVIDTISLDGLREVGLSIGGNFAHRNGDQIVFSARYFREDGSAGLLSKLAAIDIRNDVVTIDEDTRCGNIGWSVMNSAGDVYFSSHTAQGVAFAAGTAGTPASRPCLLRAQAGTNAFDDSYFVDLVDSVGRPAGALLGGAQDTAFVLIRREGAVPLTPDNAATAVRRPDWELVSLQLNDEAPAFQPVPGNEPGAAYGVSFTAEIGKESVPTPFVVDVAADLGQGTFYDVTDAGNLVEKLTVSGFPAGIIRLR